MNIALAKSLVAAILLITSTSGVVFILSAMGKTSFKGDPAKLARYHRALGRVSVLLTIILASVCIYYMVPGAPPLLRIVVHKAIGALTLLLVLGKIVAARTDRHYLPLLGRTLYVFILLTGMTSAGWYFYVMYLI